MKINSSTFLLEKESADYTELESVLQKIASELKIDNVKTATLTVNQDECTIIFKVASTKYCYYIDESNDVVIVREGTKGTFPTTFNIYNPDATLEHKVHFVQSNNERMGLSMEDVQAIINSANVKQDKIAMLKKASTSSSML